MSKACPRCRLPVTAIGRAVAATNSDGDRSGVIGICRRCSSEEGKLPAARHIQRLQPTVDRALRDPGRYYCTIYADVGAAILATALLGHPDYATRTLIALGWIPEDSLSVAATADDALVAAQRSRAIG